MKTKREQLEDILESNFLNARIKTQDVNDFKGEYKIVKKDNQ